MSLRLLPRALLFTVVALLPACSRASEAIDGGAADAQVVEAGGAPLGPAPEALREQLDLLELLPQCQLRHRGLSLDFGTVAAELHRSFEVGPFADASDGEREGATVTRYLGPRVAYDVWLDEPTGPLTVSVRGLGLGASRVSAELGGRGLGTVPLHRTGLSVLEFPGKTGELGRGRHRLLFKFSGRPRGSTQPQAEFDWLRLGAADSDERTYAAPTLRDVSSHQALDGQPRRSLALRADSSLRCPLKVAPGARLELHLGVWGSGHGIAKVTVLTADGQRQVLQERKLSGGENAKWTRVDVELGPATTELAQLELSTDEITRGGRVLFGDPVVYRLRSGASRTPAAQRVIVVLGAALDRRRLPPYGPMRQLTALGTLASSSATFMNYRAPTTLPAAVLATLLTGLHPRQHRLEDLSARLPASVPTLSVLAKQAGVRTAFFTGVPTTFPAFGFDRGWDKLEALSPVEDLAAAEVYTRAAQWLSDELKGKEPGRQLLVIHARGAHPPWDLTQEEVGKLAPEEYSGVLDARRGGVTLMKLRTRARAARRRMDDEDWTRLRALEEAALVKQDAGLGQLLRVLGKHDAWRDTLFVFMGDVGPGEAPALPYDPLSPLREDVLAAPLLLRFPGDLYAGARVESQVGTEDVARALFDALGLELPRGAGVDPIQLAGGLAPLVGRATVATLGDRYSTRLESWLLTGRFGVVPSLCQLGADPPCLSDVLDREPQAARALWQYTALHARAVADAPALPREPASLDPDTLAALTVWGNVP